MDNIYQEVIRAVENGARFKVDFSTRSLKVNRKYIIRNGEYENSLGIPACKEEEFFTNVEELYHRYKYSVPSQRSDSKSHLYFRALPEEELDDEDMMYGECRDKAQIELELYILCQTLLGFRWNSERMGRWFWQSRTEKDLVILKKWVEPEVINI